MDKMRVTGRMVRAPTNGNLLKSKMAAKGDIQFTKRLSEILNISRPTAMKKFTGKVIFTQPEIKVISDRYDLTPEDIVNIFLKGENEE